MLLGVGPFESQDCRLPAGVVNLGQTLTRVLLTGFKNHYHRVKHGLTDLHHVFTVLQTASPVVHLTPAGQINRQHASTQTGTHIHMSNTALRVGSQTIRPCTSIEGQWVLHVCYYLT
jgi:hypothetical protein